MSFSSLRPDQRIGAALIVGLFVVLLPARAVLAHGTPPELEVQALIRTATDPLTINYQFTATFADGDPADVTVSLRAVSDDGEALGPMTADPTAPGVSVLEVRYPTTGIWTVTVDASGEDGTTTVTFTERLPWPHYTAEAGIPKVKVDTVDPSREGTLITGVEGGDDATTAPVGELLPEVVVLRDLPTSTLWSDVALRLAHVAALALWVLPLLGLVFGRRFRHDHFLCSIGMVATIATGALLAVWGAPLESPGLFRWTELGERLLGTTYQRAFIAKMAATVLAAAATVVVSRRGGRRGAVTALGAMGGAVVAATIMTQAHLFTHL